MTKVLGIANFGLLDVPAWQDNELSKEGFALADVLLPQGILGRIRTGEEAESQRAHTGLSWPAEAKIHTDTQQALRRAPLPVLWRALVERGDRFAAWKTADGTEFPIGRMLAQSVCDLYSRTEEQCDDISSVRPLAIVAIPNALDETGQETFLRECVGLGMPEPYLIWRPVAAALTWLKHTEPELLTLIKTDHGDEHIHVLYFGLDALEFTTLRLRRYTHNGRQYILPLRDRPHDLSQLTGMDWAGNVIETLCAPDDFGAYWQLFTTFPEVWQAMAAHPFAAETLPRPWSTDKGWQFWEPINLEAAIQAAPACESAMLRQILKPSCSLKHYAYETTFPEQAAQEIIDLMHASPTESLQGIIACGPLLPANPTTTWLNTVLAPAVQAGMRNYSKSARRMVVWLTPGNLTIAEGATIYGERRLGDIPAYLDTMPQLSLFTITEGKQRWHPLLDAQEVLGGQAFEDTIAGKFALPSGKRQLEILLCKGIVPQDDGDALPLTPPSLSPCQARLVRYWVRTQGKETVKRRSNQLEKWAQGYALEVAANFFSDGIVANEQATTLQDEAETPFRNNIINFPSSSERDILLDVRVNMKPAAGLAKVSFTPRDKNFLDGRSIPMNYATMQPRSAPPKTQRGWPALLEIAAHPEDPALCRTRNIQFIDKFEVTSPTASNYVELINEIQNKCLKAPYQYNRGIMFFNALYPFTEKGACCTKTGNEQLCRISNKFSQDFAQLLGKKDTKTLQTLLSRATWMYLTTPQNIVDYIRTALIHDNNPPMMHNVLIESAGKCFQSADDIRLLFENITSKANTGRFPIQALRSTSRLLRYREQAPNALTEQTAGGLARHTISLMQQASQQNNFAQKFFQGVLLLLYLLRFRRVSDYFSPQNTSSMKLFQEGIQLIQSSITYFNTKNDSAKSKKATDALKDFQSFVRWEATGSYPQAVLDLAGEDDD